MSVDAVPATPFAGAAVAFGAFLAVNPGGSFIFFLLLVAFADNDNAVDGFAVLCLRWTDSLDFFPVGIAAVVVGC